MPSDRDPQLVIGQPGQALEQFGAATARVLDQKADAELWNRAQELAREKYGWGDGLPVEITPDEPFWSDVYDAPA